MALFQKTVLKKYLLEANTPEVDAAYKRFSAYFHDATRQQNIRNSKEEQFQEGFLRELFGHIFGYTLNPEPNFNITTELKNTSNSKKVDGAIVFEGKAIAVIELKGTNTTDLNSIETQAFGYKNNQSECVYVITSNFEKLRFYIDNSIDYEEFNLFTLNREQFNLLYLCLNLQSIQQHLPKRLKDESVSQEDAITKKLYKDYSEFKRALYQNLVELNPEFDKLLLFKKTQKLLDRFLFIFFAEDRLLLPTNLIFRINQEWKNLMKMRMKVSLYDRYKVYFNDLNVGAKVTLPAFGKKTGDAIEAEFEIFAYNGGLFVPDEVLDNVKIDDEVLHVYTEKMSHYDFDSDVDVNILGHIFENSLNEIDEIKSEIEGETVDKTKTRRKKDGVFYTPKYITKYIVDNTVGKLCTEKKAELNLVDEDYSNDKKIQTKTKKAHLDKLTDYRTWLLQLTICDPACGSGAFLNQALEFLIAEHRYVDELQAKLMGDSMILSDVETSILENNIYGVDLNDESVEIAKLSLWLRTAQKGRKLNSLNNNIKCGNSLIDDPEVAGEKAFSWEKEFPEVFKEKNKFAFHITTALHDSRTSDRMVKYKARERRFEGTKPDPEVFPMTKEEEELIASTVADIVREDKLNIAAFNLCWDHMHILLVCEEEEVPKIMHKIKGRTARACNMLRNKGINPLDVLHKDGSTPFWTQKYGCKPVTTEEHFWNTYNYIENNKVKHDLPKNPKLEKIIFGFVKTYEDCFRTEYNGGFDVVIGNPPYVRQELFKEIKPYLEKHYECYNSIADLYTYFIEKGIDLMNSKGLFSFILPNKFLKATYGKEIRNVMLSESNLELLVDFDDYPIFEDATTYPLIFIINKVKSSSFYYSAISQKNITKDPINLIEYNKRKIDATNLDENNWNFSSDIENQVINKIKNNSVSLTKYVNGKINRGILTGKNDVFIFNESFKKNLLEKGVEAELIKPILLGSSIKRYNINFTNDYILFTRRGIEIDKFPNAKSYLLNYYEELKPRNNGEVIGRKAGSYRWFEIQDNVAYFEDFETMKIVYPRTNNQCNFQLDSSGFYLSDNNFYIKSESKTLLGILNSKLVFYYLKSICTTLQGGYFDFRRDKIDTIPLPKDLTSITKIEDLVKGQLNSNRSLSSILQKLSTYVSSQYQLEKLSGKLTNWYELDFPDFIKELNKAIKTAKGTPLTKKDEFEWMELFEENKKKALALKAEIDRTDKEIDQMVYELYGLTEEEIRIVEGN